MRFVKFAVFWLMGIVHELFPSFQPLKLFSKYSIQVSYVETALIDKPVCDSSHFFSLRLRHARHPFQ